MFDDNKNHGVTLVCIRDIEEESSKKFNVINTQKDQEIILCTFCGKLPHQVHMLIQSETGVNICNECVVFSKKLLNDKCDN